MAPPFQSLYSPEEDSLCDMIPSTMGIMGEACRAEGSCGKVSIPISSTDKSWEGTKRRKHLSGKSNSKNLGSKGEGVGPGREKGV